MKKSLVRIISAVLLVVAVIINMIYQGWPSLVLYLISYILVGGDIILKAIRNIIRVSF